MKYVKILSLEAKSSATVAQCFDVPLNMLVPVSIAGEFDKESNNVIQSSGEYYINTSKIQHRASPGQIIGLCINKIDPNLNGPDRFSYLYDASSSRRVFIGDLNAFSWGELVMKLAIAGLIYSTDDEVMEVPVALKTVAEPGASEHHLGLAMDVGQQSKPNLSEKFAETEGGIWTRENCWRFGFILRYGEEWEAVTGYKYEPWHFRYVGKELAKEIHDANVPFETWMTGYRVRVLQGILGKDTE